MSWSCFPCSSNLNFHIINPLVVVQQKVDLLEASSSLSIQMSSITYHARTPSQIKKIKKLLKEGKSLIAQTKENKYHPLPSFEKICLMNHSKRQKLYQKICGLRDKLIHEVCPVTLDVARTELFEKMKNYYPEFLLFASRHQFLQNTPPAKEDEAIYTSLLTDFIFKAKEAFNHLTIGKEKTITRFFIDNMEKKDFAKIKTFFDGYQIKLNTFVNPESEISENSYSTAQLQSVPSKKLTTGADQNEDSYSRYLIFPLSKVMDSEEIRNKFFSRNINPGIGIPYSEEKSTPQEKLLTARELMEETSRQSHQKKSDTQEKRLTQEEIRVSSVSQPHSRNDYLDPYVFARFLHLNESPY